MKQLTVPTKPRVAACGITQSSAAHLLASALERICCLPLIKRGPLYPFNSCSRFRWDQVTAWGQRESEGTATKHQALKDDLKVPQAHHLGSVTWDLHTPVQTHLDLLAYSAMWNGKHGRLCIPCFLWSVFTWMSILCRTINVISLTNVPLAILSSEQHCTLCKKKKKAPCEEWLPQASR